jgi:predicted nucleotidyltransferase
MPADLNLPPDISSLISRLRTLPFVTEVTLFGSRARGDHRPDSDFDLLVLLNEAGREGQRRLKDLENELNNRGGVVVQILGIEESQLKRRLRAGEIVIFDALVEGTDLYPARGAAPRHRDLAGAFSLKAASSQWMAVVEDSIAGSEAGHEILPTSHPLSRYFDSYVPVRAQALAVAATRSAMWAAYCLGNHRPDRAAALDTMAKELGWPTDSLAELLEPLTNKEEAKAQLTTEIATNYVDRARQLAAEKGVTPARLGYRAVEAYRQIQEKHKSRLDGSSGIAPAVG